MNNISTFDEIYQYIIDNQVAGVLTDLDDTLYQYQGNHIKAITTCANTFANYYGDMLSTDEFIAKYRHYRNVVTDELIPQGCCRSRMFAFQLMFEELNIESAYLRAYEYEKLYWDIFIPNIQVDPQAKIFIKKCYDNNIPVCIVTDLHAHFQVRKLQHMDLIKYIPHFVTSEDAGIEKPHPQIFSKALGKLKMDKNQVIMIGDNYKKDIVGADNYGIKAFQIKL